MNPPDCIFRVSMFHYLAVHTSAQGIFQMTSLSLSGELVLQSTHSYIPLLLCYLPSYQLYQLFPLLRVHVPAHFSIHS